MKKHLALFALVLISLMNCSPDDGAWKNCSETPGLIFQTGFNDCSIYALTDHSDRIEGTDSAFTNANVWEDIPDHPNIGNIHLNYEDGDKSQRYAILTNDPFNPNNRVLMFTILEPHIHEGSHMKGRVSATLYDCDCLREYYQKVSVYLHPDMEYLTQGEETFTWLMLFEFWNIDGNTSNFRISVNIAKEESGPVDALHLRVSGDNEKFFGGWDNVWKETAENYAIPFGEWIDIELYIKEGEDQTGRFYLAVSDSTTNNLVLFDLTRRTKHDKDQILNGFTMVNPLKLYTSDELINYMKVHHKKLEVYWDNWSVYKYRRPGDTNF